MDYKEKYEMALEGIQEILGSGADSIKMSRLQLRLQGIFPELKESEDEQHRKWILEYLYDGLRNSDEQFKDQFKCAIAWFEKQGDQKPASSEIEPIPLTEEFFEKNGIKKVVYNYIEPCVIFESDDKRIQINEWTNSGDGYWNVHIDNEDFDTIGSCDVKYVHQFQQLLRLCGYEMDVVV